MKRKLIIFIVAFALAAIYFNWRFPENPVSEIVFDEEIDYSNPQNWEEGELIVMPPEFEFSAENRSFDTSDASFECGDNPAVCAVDLAVRCTINPKAAFCDRKKLPRYIFMDGEDLGRPTKIDYKIVNDHPIDMNTVEIQTTSVCDGRWFGLCNGNIIYVISNISGEWVVKDVYALETY